MKQLIRNFDTSNNAHADWDTLKSKIKEYSINQSKMINKSCKIKIKEIENKLSEIDGPNTNSIDINKKRQLEKELKDLIDKKAKGAQI